MKNRIYMMFITMIIGSSIVTFSMLGCSEEPGPPWPSDYGEVFSVFITDPADDLEAAPGGSPPYPVDFPPADVIKISSGIHEQYLYFRYDSVGTIPTAPINISENPPVEAQTVVNQNTNIAMNIDDDIHSFEVMYQITFTYGVDNRAFAYFDPDPPDSDYYQSFVYGEVGEGGPGYNYAISRYSLEKLGSYFTKGKDTLIVGGVEAGTHDASGNELYHHFAYDYLGAMTITLPE